MAEGKGLPPASDNGTVTRHESGLNWKLDQESPVQPHPPKQQCVVHVVYRDHILFRNTDSALFNPPVRETLGWLIKENNDAVWILWDRSITPVAYEKSQYENQAWFCSRMTSSKWRRYH